VPEVITRAIWSSIDRVPSCRATVSLAELMIKPHKVKNASLEVPTVRKNSRDPKKRKGKKTLIQKPWKVQIFLKYKK